MKDVLVEALLDRAFQAFQKGIPFYLTQGLEMLPIGRSLKAAYRSNGLVVEVEILGDLELNEGLIANTDDFYDLIDNKIVTHCQIGFEDGIPQAIIPLGFY